MQYFTLARWLGNYATLICIPAKGAIALIERHLITDVRNLEGRTCVIEESNGIVEFVDLFDA